MAHQVVETEMALQAAKAQRAQNQTNEIHATVRTVHPTQINQLVRKSKQSKIPVFSAIPANCRLFALQMMKIKIKKSRPRQAHW